MSLRGARPEAIPKSMVFAWVSWRKIMKMKVSFETLAKKRPGPPEDTIRGKPRRSPGEGGEARAEAEERRRRGGGGRRREE